MRRDKKGMTMALGVIIAIVVLIVVALAVIAITSGSLSRLAGSTEEQQATTALRTQCESWFTQWCISHPGQSAPAADDYPEYTVQKAGVDYTFACDDVQMLGDRTCGGNSSATFFLFFCLLI